MGMNSEIKNYWNAVADKSEYVGGYLELGLKMLLKVCTDRRMFCKMTRWDPETAAANVAAARAERLNREEKIRTAREEAERKKMLDELPKLPKSPTRKEIQQERKRLWWRKYRRSKKYLEYQKEYKRKMREQSKENSK